MTFRNWTAEDVQNHQARIKNAPVPAKPSKYGNKKMMIDGITFDSQKEGARYLQLKTLERAGKISKFELQKVFELCPAVTIQGKKKRALTYRADFCYEENGQVVVEDVKGMVTDVYKIKRHLMKHLFGIDVRET